jgi:hypothetical protein
VLVCGAHFFLLFSLSLLFFRVNLQSAAVLVATGARISPLASALYSPPESAAAAFIIIGRV